MKLYQCHKQVHAEPMTRGEYNIYRGWPIPADEKLDYPNPRESAEKLFAWKNSPQSLFPNAQPKLTLVGCRLFRCSMLFLKMATNVSAMSSGGLKL